MKANEQNPWADWYQIRAKGSVLTSHFAKLSEDSAAAIKRLAWRRWCLIMHTLSINVILSNVKCTHKIWFFNAQDMHMWAIHYLWVERWGGMVSSCWLHCGFASQSCRCIWTRTNCVLPRELSFATTFNAQRASYLPQSECREHTLPTVQKHKLCNLSQQEHCWLFSNLSTVHKYVTLFKPETSG